eukprot:32456-Amphidinium_carterae.1
MWSEIEQLMKDIKESAAVSSNMQSAAVSSNMQSPTASVNKTMVNVTFGDEEEIVLKITKRAKTEPQNSAAANS